MLAKRRTILKALAALPFICRFTSAVAAVDDWYSVAYHAYGDAAEAQEKCAQDSGLNTSAVRSFVDAASGNNLEERKRNAEQLSLLFDEVKG